MAFDKDEHHEFMIEDLTDIRTECDAVKFRVTVLNLKSPMGGLKYNNLATLALQLLSIPASNADSERVFSLVRRIKTDNISSLSTLLTIQRHDARHTSLTRPYFLLSKAKTCRRERNLSYIK